MSATQNIIIYTDGGARGNPGPAGAGIVAYNDEKKIFELKKYLGDNRTNNWAEYEALILALTEAKKKGLGGKELEIRMDSELIVRQMTNEYQVKEETLWPQYMKAHNLLVAHFPNVKFVHVRREENKEADKLVNEAIDTMLQVTD
ncbi:ribonuclease HI family protein [Candidatus Kaiserbacteria bacterium]|nr:ribonuclease HI family protein [Candidatus Kaiserbacteria bacterium]